LIIQYNNLITIIALIHYQGSVLPEKRVELYDAATSTFLENWVRQREVNKNINFSRADIIELLAPVAMHMHDKCIDGLIDEQELNEIIVKEFLKINPYTPKKEAKAEVQSLIEFIRQDAGFIFEKGYGENGMPKFGFVHLTFQEYFASVEFVTRWKEGAYVSSMADFIFNTSWREVILLAAAQFRISDQPRIARKLATDFIDNILSVEDEYPNLLRPLKLVCRILSDDVEIHLDKFAGIIDKVFYTVLNTSPDSGVDYDDEVEGNNSVFEYFLSDIITSKNYQSYLLSRMEEELDKNENTELRHNIIRVLMSSCDNDPVRNLLWKIIDSDNEDNKACIFGYNVVYPVAAIVTTSRFKDSIVKYINSDNYVSSFDGSIPIQYISSFELFESSGLEIEEGRKVSNYLEAVEVVNDSKVKQEVVEFIAFSIGSMNLTELSEYITLVKGRFADVDLSRLNKHIFDLEKLESCKLKEYEIFGMPGLKMYQSATDDKKFAFILGEDGIPRESGLEVIEFYMPLEIDLTKFEKILKDRLVHFKVFLELILDFVSVDGENKVHVENIEEMYAFIRFSKFIHWSISVDISNVYDMVLMNVFCDDSKTEMLIEWLVFAWDKFYFNRGNTVHKKGPEYIRQVEESSIDPCYKVFLLKVVGDKKDYGPFVKSCMSGYNSLSDSNTKRIIRNMLLELL
jgi:hypothetical protein